MQRGSRKPICQHTCKAPLPNEKSVLEVESAEMKQPSMSLDRFYKNNDKAFTNLLHAK